MGETLTRHPDLPKLLGHCIVHLSRLLLSGSPGLIGVVVTVFCQCFTTEMFPRQVPGMVRQPPMERRTRHPA